MMSQTLAEDRMGVNGGLHANIITVQYTKSLIKILLLCLPPPNLESPLDMQELDCTPCTHLVLPSNTGRLCLLYAT
jgi:hypothetical protein